MRVLQIEDDETTAQVVAETLKSKGFTCDTASLGEEAVDLAVRNRYDLILLDIMLPDIDGYEVLRRLRDAQIHTPVVIQSALVGREALDQAEALGAVDRLIKPFTGNDLRACVASILERAGSEELGMAPAKLGDDQTSRRRHKRIATLKSAEIVGPDENRISRCVVVNLSLGGAALQITEEAEIPETFRLKLERGPEYHCHVCWRHGKKVGVMFSLSAN